MRVLERYGGMKYQTLRVIPRARSNGNLTSAALFRVALARVTLVRSLLRRDDPREYWKGMECMSITNTTCRSEARSNEESRQRSTFPRYWHELRW